MISSWVTKGSRGRTSTQRSSKPSSPLPERQDPDRRLRHTGLSNEPDEGTDAGDGNFPGDVRDADPGRADFDLLLRAERARGGAGRAYTLLYTAVDGSGNTAAASGVVRVPPR